MKNSTKLLWAGAGALIVFSLVWALVLRFALMPLEASSDPSASLTNSGSTGVNILTSRFDGGQEERKELGVGQTWGLETGNFDSIQTSGSWDVTVVQGSTWGVDVESPSHTGIEIQVEKNGSTLILVDNEAGKPGHYDGNPVVVRLTMPTLVRVDAAGSLKFKAQDIALGDLKFAGAGSGDVTLTGKAASLDLAVSGSWNVTGNNLQTRDIHISASGSGSVGLGARDSNVQGQISGAFNLGLYGKPSSQSVMSSGTSSIHIW